MAGPISRFGFSRRYSFSSFTRYRQTRSAWKALICQTATYYWLSFATHSLSLFLDVAAYGVLQNSGFDEDEVQRTIALLFLLHLLWSLFFILMYFIKFTFQEPIFAIDHIKLSLLACLSCQSPIIILLLLGPATLLKGFTASQTTLKSFLVIEGLSIISSLSLCIASWITYTAAVRARGEWYLPVDHEPVVSKWTMAPPSDSSKCSNLHIQLFLSVLGPNPLPEAAPTLVLRRLILYYLEKTQGHSLWQPFYHRLTYYWITLICISVSLISAIPVLSIQEWDKNGGLRSLRTFAIVNTLSLLLIFIRFWSHYQKTTLRKGFCNAYAQVRIGILNTFLLLIAVLVLCHNCKVANDLRGVFLLFIIFPSSISPCASLGAAYITAVAAMEAHGFEHSPEIPRPTVAVWRLARGYELEGI
ncbi:hypothetical protein CPB84DRAFT_1769742 [Gymnopilus junonius]|uniref:Uncharacterized protein n=1 Tax=Gymnopilus junonius TaxID=109634 RepID=A0A9P5NWF4_GYMJU|nr:hypothetical protein CPB84DRAFT_1769742 [Gymnopilus junonius]